MTVNCTAMPIGHNGENHFRSKLSYLTTQSKRETEYIIFFSKVRAITCVWLNFCIDEQQRLLIKKLAEIGRQVGIPISSVPSTNVLAKIKF